jgi:hypothetical protein
MKGMMKYLFRLPERRARPLASRLVSDRQPDRAYVGALYLARQGDRERAIPILVDNLARNPDARNLFMGLVYASAHGGDATHIRRLFQEMAQYAEENRDRYSEEERARLDGLLMSGAGLNRR